MCGETALLVLPVQSGRTRLAMHLLSELEAARWNDDGQALDADGVTGVAWYMSVQPAASYLIAQIHGTAPVRGFVELAMADSDVALWLRACIGEISGMDVNARTLERLIHAPLACIPADQPAPAPEQRMTPGNPNGA